jgi:hypothetical protein
MTMQKVVRRALLALMCTVVLGSLAEEQDKYTNGDFRGFTVNEHVIQRSKDNFALRSIKGQIFFSDDNGYPMEGALFEIRGPGSSETVRSVITDANGFFEFKDVPEGAYIFKASSLGFNAYAGRITLSRMAKARSLPRIFLQPGF